MDRRLVHSGSRVLSDAKGIVFLWHLTEHKSASGVPSINEQWEHEMQRTIGFSLLLVASIVGLAVAQNDHHGDANAGKPDPTTSAFTTQMMQAMDRMNAGMMAANPTGDPDRYFAAMMIPHHQGAVDMAKLQLIYGRDRVLRRLAQAIIVEQQQEIELMQRSLRERSDSRP